MTSMLPISDDSIDTTSRRSLSPLQVPERLLLGPGPSNAEATVVAAMNCQPIGHLDPAYLTMMDEVQTLLRYAWQTHNEVTFLVPGTGSAAMEATLANVIEPGDRVVVGVMGYFGHRLVDMAERYGADVHTMHQTWGHVFSLETIRAALEQHRPAVLALVHAETSTGARQPLEEVGALEVQIGGVAEGAVGVEGQARDDQQDDMQVHQRRDAEESPDPASFACAFSHQSNVDSSPRTAMNQRP